MKEKKITRKKDYNLRSILSPIHRIDVRFRLK